MKKTNLLSRIATVITAAAIACGVVALPTTSISASAAAPAGAASFNGNRYMIFVEDVTWKEAKALCEAKGGHLATITSKLEQAFIEKLNSEDKSLWIGGRREKGNDWYWVTGEEWKYTNWDDGEPNNSSNVVANENSVAVWPKKWNDLNEKNKAEQDGYICEWEEANAPGTTKITTAKVKNKKLLVKYKKVSDAAGYEIQYSTKKNFKKAKTQISYSISKQIKKLKKGRKYFVRVRAFYEKAGGRVYGEWSKARKVKS